MNRLFDEPFSREEEQGMQAGAWSPSVDIHEADKELVLTAELPGVEENDIEVNLEGNVLFLKGKREFEKETKEEDYHRIERSYGSFYRSFRLPHYVDQDKIKAEYEDGLLKLRMPKKAELKAKKVKVLKPTSKKEATKK
jgi:HSP20 family protein